MTARRGRDGTLSAALLLVANILIPAAILVFATGFFPYKPLLPGLASYDAVTEYGDPPEAPFDRLVFMVVDALRRYGMAETQMRSSFVDLRLTDWSVGIVTLSTLQTAASSSLNRWFLPAAQYILPCLADAPHSLIRDGAALPFTAHATSPTVTMPRLKAMTTGSIPSFLDVVLNLDEGDESSSLASQDTWLAQMKAKRTGKLLMYGDDTWLKLFPGTFDRADGTTSFFVSVSSARVVEKQARSEQESADDGRISPRWTTMSRGTLRTSSRATTGTPWCCTISAWITLATKAGHGGRAAPACHEGCQRLTLPSPHMVVKQREMDDIVRQVYAAMASEDHLRSTLFVVCGDHGMNDAGNHGASSPGETSPALVFMSPKLRDLRSNLRSPLPEDESFQYYSTVEQSDLAPTLAALLGFPVPKNNLGALIPEFLPFWSNSKCVEA